jgi:3-dehydroquinate synthase II
VTGGVVLVRVEPGGPDRPEAIAAHAGRRGIRVVAEGPAPAPTSSDARWEEGALHLSPTLLPPAGGVLTPVVVDSPEALAGVAASLRAGSPVLVEWTDERVLPLETLVAARVRRGTLWVLAERVEDVPVFLGALEHGADGVLVRVRDLASLDRLEAVLERAVPAIAWTPAEVVRVAPAGLGDRVLVDTTSLLGPEEGLLVGSRAALLLPVASEATGSRFTRPRPFRVNAGGPHQYTLLSDGSTRYLSELEPGDSVVIVVPGHGARSVRVGRLKIERRPLTQVTVEAEGARSTAFLQEAETVRLLTDEGPVPVPELRPGQRLAAGRFPAGRHLGVSVEETIVER